jgi:hypothetical protein
VVGRGNPPIWAAFVTVPIANKPERPTADAYAHDVFAEITYYRGDEAGFTIRGRWTGSPQVVDLGPYDQDPPQRIDLPPNGEWHELDIAVRFAGYERYCFAYNTYSQRRGIRLDEWCLADVSHFVHIELSGNAVTADAWYLLENHSDLLPDVPGFELRLCKVSAPLWASSG